MDIVVAPMDLRLGDVLSDSRSEWEVISPPFSTRGGSIVHVRVRKVDQPDWTNRLTWGNHERVSVKRASVYLPPEPLADGLRETTTMKLLSAIAVLLGALLLGACTTGQNTPQQDLVWSTYNQCKVEGRVPSSIQLDRVEPDGRAWYSANRTSYGTQELESCMTEKTRTSKTPIPPAYPPVISR